MPYLILENAPVFAEFVKNSFQGKQTMCNFRDDGTTIAHAELQISGSTIMFSEATDQWKVQTASLFLWVDNADAAYQAALQNGATTVLELSDQSYGRTCGVKDPCGNTWWVTSVR